MNFIVPQSVLTGVIQFLADLTIPLKTVQRYIDQLNQSESLDDKLQVMIDDLDKVT